MERQGDMEPMARLVTTWGASPAASICCVLKGDVVAATAQR